MSANKKAPSLAYAWFVVAILMVAYVFSFVDRQILNLLVGPIRRDLGISDTQMSLLMGLSFAIFYTILGIPLGRLADNKSRRGLIAAGVILWSVMTALCGTAKAYWQMFLFRIGVGVGEAALSPAAYSMIADYFPREKRATAMSVYGMGIYLGAGLAFVVGGLVIQFVTKQGAIELPVIGMTHPWQFVFLILGAAGVVFSLAFAFVREPERQGVATVTPLRDVLAYLWAQRRTVLCHNVGFALIAFASYGASAWVPTFLMRTFGAAPGDVGITYGLIVMVFGCAGIVGGGWLTDRGLKAGKTDAALRVGIAAAIGTAVSHVPFLLVNDLTLAYVAMAPAVFFLGMPFGAAPAAIQEVVPNRMRGQASAIYLFVVNLIGLGIGPTAVALITDYVFGYDEAVRWSLLIVALTASALAAVTLAAGLKPYRESLKLMRA